MKKFEEKDMSEFAKLDTVKDKANFLLGFEIHVKSNIINLDVFKQAYIGHVGLPITGSGTDAELIAKARTWLENKAS